MVRGLQGSRIEGITSRFKVGRPALAGKECARRAVGM
jgi:hypothetical protein